MTQKLIFFDIDGTLLDAEKQLPESTKAALGELHDAGHIVALATGRAPFAFQWLLKELNIDSYVCLNGQYVVHNSKTIYKNPIKLEAIASLEKYARERKHPLVHLTYDDWYANTPNDSHIIEATSSLKLDTTVKYDPEFYQKGEIYQTLLFCIEPCATEYEQTFDQLAFIRWHPYSMDVLPAGGSKSAGISKLIEELQLPEHDIYAFGDGLNDIEMLKSVHNSIAMGNATDIVKQAAGSVTRDVNDDGIWHGLRAAGLLG